MGSLPVRAPKPAVNSRELRLFVPYTTQKLTARALRAAMDLAGGLSVQVSVVAVQVVPFACPLDRPPVAVEHMKRELGELAGNAGMPVQGSVVLARDREDGFRHALKPGSLILIAVRRRPWRTSEEELARRLAKAGYSVAMVAA